MEPEKYNCLVVDDEPIARKIIVNYIEQMPSLQLAGECINALATIDYLRSNNNINIIFLDINMPNLSGVQLLKIVQPQQPVIFTTAYPEYAVESILSMDGRVLESKTSSGAKSIQMNVSRLPAGVYVVRVTTNAQVTNRVITVSR